MASARSSSRCSPPSGSPSPSARAFSPARATAISTRATTTWFSACSRPEPSARPLDAFAARRALTSLAWPDVIEPAAHPIRARAVSERPEALRALPHRSRASRAIEWLERGVELVPLSEAALVRARAFARAGHRGLQDVLRVDRDAAVIWLEAIGAGTAAPSAATLTAEQKAALADALEALHGEGAVHGHIARATLAITAAGEATLRFASASPAGATAADDRLALAMVLGVDG